MREESERKLGVERVDSMMNVANSKEDREGKQAKPL